MIRPAFRYIVIFLLIFFLVFVADKLYQISPKKGYPSPTPTVATQKTQDSVSYIGKEGKDALTLLKEQATVEQDRSGLVVSINGRKADTAKHEYWAFYVNGQLAQVGPADYKTKDGDKIEWKIEKY